MSLPLIQGNEDQPWWLRYGAKGLGCGGGIVAMALGLFNCITLSSDCAIAGVLQMLAAFVVIAAEAPFCCMFLECVNAFSKWVDMRPPWQKAVVYIIISLPPFIMCQSLSTFFGSGLLLACGVLYGMMAVGKKGKREDMVTTASSPSSVFTMKSNLVEGEAPTAVVTS